MKEKTICLIDEHNIELLVVYECDPPSNEERSMVLTSVELVIAGTGINITRQLTPRQITAVCSAIVDQTILDYI